MTTAAARRATANRLTVVFCARVENAFHQEFDDLQERGLIGYAMGPGVGGFRYALTDQGRDLLEQLQRRPGGRERRRPGLRSAP